MLLVEDEYFQAMDAKSWLELAGAQVIGPATDGTQAASLLPGHRIDAAVVDVNLGAGADFAMGRELRRLGIPFLFLTGYDYTVLPEDLEDVRCLNKPADAREVVAALGDLLT